MVRRKVMAGSSLKNGVQRFIVNPTSDVNLVAAGVGRDRTGNDISNDSSTAARTAYAGDLTAKGSVSFEDAALVSRYGLTDSDGNIIEASTVRGATSTYGNEYGTLTLTKTASGVNFSFALSKNSEAVQALDHNDTTILPFNITPLDANGDSLVVEGSVIVAPLSFELLGTNTAPVMSIARDFNDVTVNANESLYDIAATGKISINDPDAGDHFMNQTLSGKASLVPNVIAKEADASQQADGVVMVVEGKYGNLTVYTNGHYRYELAEDGAYGADSEQRIALESLSLNQRATETFTITTTDQFGATHSQNVAFTVVGANDTPQVLDANGDVVLAGELALDLSFTLSGVGRDRAGNAYEGESATQAQENATYKAVAATGFIAIREDLGDTFTPLLYNDEGVTLVGKTSGSTTTFTTEAGDRIVFTRATVDGVVGFKVSFTYNESNMDGALSEGHVQDYMFYNFAVRDKAGLESIQTKLNLSLTGSNEKPELTLSPNTDMSVYGGSEDSNVAIDFTKVDINGDSLDLSITSKLTEENTVIGGLASDSVSINGKFGTLIIDPNTNNFSYTVADPTDATDQGASMKELSDKKASATESFEIVLTDEFGASVTQTIDIRVFGNKAELNATDTSLIAAGVGRSANGTLHPTNENLAYAGNLTAAGTVKVNDAEKVGYDFELSYMSEDDEGNPISVLLEGVVKGAVTTFSLDEGSLAITKTATGYSYKFTMDKNSEKVKLLEEDELHNINLNLHITDNDGLSADNIPLNFEIKGTNDAPLITFTHEGDLLLSQMGDIQGLVPDNSVTSQIDILDDATAVHDFKLTFGKNVAELAEGSSEIVMQGTYGTLTLDLSDASAPSMTYALAGEGAQFDALVKLGDAKLGSERFTITVTDEFGVARSQVVTYSVRGGLNDALPEFTSISYNTATTANADLKAAGYQDGSNKVYAGYLVARGVLKASDDDKDSLTFSVGGEFVLDDPVVKGSTTTYTILDASGEALGTLALVKVNTTTTNYTFTLSKTNAMVKDLVSTNEANELYPDDAAAALAASNLEIIIPLQVSDGRGGITEGGSDFNIVLNVQGSNDGPVFVLDGAADTTVTAIDAPTATGSVILTDPDSTAVGDAVDPSLYDFSLLFGTKKGVVSGNEITVSGKYGDLVFNTENLEYSYTLGGTTAQENAVKALKDGQVLKDNFSINTTVDPDNITAKLPISFEVTGSNDAPEITAQTGPDALIMSGVGRTSLGAIHATNDNIVYKGDHISRGTVSVKEHDAEVLSYELDGHEISRVSGANRYFDTEHGTLILTKTAAGVSYSLTLDPTKAAFAEFKTLAEGVESAPFTYTINISDGTHQVQQDVTFTVMGTNDAPVFIGDALEQTIYLGQVDALVDNANRAEHNFQHEDVDGTVESMSITLNGKTLTYNINDLPAAGEALISGKYGDVYYDVSNYVLRYEVGVTSAQQTELGKITAHKVVQDNFSVSLTDNLGAKTTQVFENELIGSDLPDGQTSLIISAKSTNTAVIDDGFGRNASGVDLTANTNPNDDVTPYGGDFIASGTLAVHATHRSEALRIGNDYGIVVGNVTTFQIEGEINATTVV